MEQKKRFNKRVFCIILACLLVVSSVPLVYAEVTADDPDELALYIGSAASHAIGNESYAAYLDGYNFNGTLAKDTIKVDMNAYETGGDLTAAVRSDGVYTDGVGSISWTFEVKKTGFYNVQLTYASVEGNKTDMVRNVLIDGENPYDGWDQQAFTRLFDNNCGETLQMVGGNEVRPVAVQLYTPNTVWLRDPLRRDPNPYVVYLRAGSHTITFETVREELMAYQALTFCAAPETETYADVISTWTEDYELYTGDPLVYQAERTAGGTTAVYKTSNSIRNLVDYTSSKSYPYHPYNSMLNTIGGSSWQTPGQKITWEIEVPSEGLYALSFRARQGTRRGTLAFRSLSINGEVPFAEADSLGFMYSADFQNYTVRMEDEVCLFHFKEGKNTVTMEVIAGDMVTPITAIETSMNVLNELYRRVVRITGASPDKYIDYEIAKKIPDFSEIMQQESEKLQDTVKYLEQLTGEKGEQAALVETMAIQAAKLAEEPEMVVEEVEALKNNISSLGTCLTSMSEFPLEVDSLTLYAPETAPVGAEAGPLEELFYGSIRFFSTFFVDETAMTTDTPTEGGDASVPQTNEKDVLKVWIPSGRDQAQILRGLIDSGFIRDDVTVDLQLVPLGVVLPSTLAGTGPDVVVHIGYETIIDYAMRGAVVDFSTLEGFEQQKTKYFESALQTTTYQGGVYGIPETQSFLMMYCRDDILEEMGLTAPRTWKEFEETLVRLNAAEYDVYLPGVSLFQTLVYQNGGDLYTGTGKDYGISSGLYSESSMQAFTQLTKFYTSYTVPVSANFANRFRSGEMPIGIADYTLYNTLELFAPEIRGLWSFHTLPGVEDANGNINNVTVSSSAGSVILKSCENLDAAWDFVQWWTSTDVQLAYAQSLEAVLGTSGRYATANKEVLEQLSWTNAALDALTAQFENTIAMPVVPGSYMTTRMVTYAFNSVVTDSQAMSAREALYLNLTKIDSELTRKRKEFHQSYINEAGQYVSADR